jgi:hypothetical protein
MTVTKSDVYIFHDAEKTEKAIDKMRKAIGKKHEAAAAVKFAHTILDLWGERETIENEAERKRLDLLYAYYKINAVRNQVREAIEYASDLAGKVYDEYSALGGNWLEEKAYRTGKTVQEARDEEHSKKPSLLISTRTKEPEEAANEKAAVNT